MRTSSMIALRDGRRVVEVVLQLGRRGTTTPSSWTASGSRRSCQGRKIDSRALLASRGPLNTARPPQGIPAGQAGNSPQGQDSRQAYGAGWRRQHRRGDEGLPSMRKKVAAAGRDPDSCKGCMWPRPRSARATTRLERVRRRQAHRNAAPELALAQMAADDIDFPSSTSTRRSASSRPTASSTLKRFLKQATLREIAQNYK